MQPSRSVLAIALIICSSLALAADGDEPRSSEVLALASQASAPRGAATPSRSDTKQFRGFFGYLEFDIEPDALGRVPGFGALSEQPILNADARQN